MGFNIKILKIEYIEVQILNSISTFIHKLYDTNIILKKVFYRVYFYKQLNLLNIKKASKYTTF